MTYQNNEPILIGDKVDLSGGSTGIVVANISSGHFTDKYSEKDWAYLLVGFLVESTDLGVVGITGSGSLQWPCRFLVTQPDPVLLGR